MAFLLVLSLLDVYLEAILKFKLSIIEVTMRSLPIYLGLAALAKHVSALVAFPGAEGFGANAVGARGASGSSVYVVTNLAASGAGSLLDGLSASGRTIVFAVGGGTFLQFSQPFASLSNRKFVPL